MKWYKKQLDALKKKEGPKDSTTPSGVFDAQKQQRYVVSRNPVGQRNRNRDKTDSKPQGR